MSTLNSMLFLWLFALQKLAKLETPKWNNNSFLSPSSCLSLCIYMRNNYSIPNSNLLICLHKEGTMCIPLWLLWPPGSKTVPNTLWLNQNCNEVTRMNCLCCDYTNPEEKQDLPVFFLWFSLSLYLHHLKPSLVPKKIHIEYWDSYSSESLHVSTLT